MTTQQFEVPRAEALVQWRNYNAALKTRSDAYLKDMRTLYNQLKSGRKVVDVFASMKMASLNERGEPKLAICPAHARKCIYRRWENGSARFSNLDSYYFWRDPSGMDVQLPADSFPRGPTAQSANNLTAPLPFIPPQFLPAGDLSGYFLLWEVETWTQEPPVDPMLLKRLTPNMFVVLAVWNLTPLEQAVLRGRM